MNRDDSLRVFWTVVWIGCIVAFVLGIVVPGIRGEPLDPVLVVLAGLIAISTSFEQLIDTLGVGDG